MQSSNRIYFLIIAICALLIVIVWVVVVQRVTSPVIVDETPVSNDPSVVPVSQQAVIPLENNHVSAAQLYLNTKAGAPAAIDNFLQTSLIDTLEDGIYLIGEEAATNGPLYEIFFYRGGSIGITLLDPNLTFARNRAEEKLREILGVSDLRICSYIVSTTVPAWLSQQLQKDYSGIDFGLSFCPGGIPISSFE